MRRDILLLTEMIDAAEQAQQLTTGITVGQLETDRLRRDALLWNFTVLGEAAGQLSAEIKDKFPDMLWQQPIGLRKQSARIAERSLMAAERPLLMSSRLQDPEQKIQFLEGRFLRVTGGAATLEVADGVVYMVISVRNVGTGLAVMHGWRVEVSGQPQLAHPPLEDFTTQTRDIYVAPGDVGFWQGAWVIIS